MVSYLGYYSRFLKKTTSRMLTRLISLVPIIFLQQYCCTQAVKSGGQLKIHSYYNQALYGFSYSNITTSPMQECLQHCLSDCLCQTFQICGNTCQLCSNLTGSNAGQLNSTAIRENIGCNRFEFEHRNNLWLDDYQCGRTCTTGINCCLTSQPCLNKGICMPLLDKNKRFNCKCIDGYTGHRCTEKPKSCRAFLNGNQKAGFFQIFDNNDNPYTVYCSFDNQMAWTLVQSFKYSNRGGYMTPIYKNDPKNQNSPSPENYRLSWLRMNDIHEDSNSKWRSTCNFRKDGRRKTDYVRATHADVPLLHSATSQHNGCKFVEYIDIRNKNSCTNCAVFIKHGDSTPIHINSLYSKTKCSTNFPGSKSCGEQNFGLYNCVNDKHRCSATEESTTQLWFGGT